VSTRKENNNISNQSLRGDLDSPFLEEEYFTEASNDEWETRMALLEAENPFQRAFELSQSEIIQLEERSEEFSDEYEWFETEDVLEYEDIANEEVESIENSQENLYDDYEEFFLEGEEEFFTEDNFIEGTSLKSNVDLVDLEEEAAVYSQEETGDIEEYGEELIDEELITVEYETVAIPSQLVGPAIGPIHTGVIPPPLDLRKGVPAGAVISPLAVTLRGLRKAPYLMKKVSQIVIHQTSRGPANRSMKSGYRKPAVDFALDYYLKGNGGFPHYVIDFNGTIYATCDERYVAHHSGWVHSGGRALFEKSNWRAPAWWLAVWGKFNFKSPIDLLPEGAGSPNIRSIGIELMMSPNLRYTEQQYKSLARLVIDIGKRHGLSIPSAPSPVLLGHEDYAPVLGKGGRADKNGGWDPGAHRTNPYFSWSKLWEYVRSMPSTALTVGVTKDTSTIISPHTVSSTKANIVTTSMGVVRFAQKILNTTEGERLVEDNKLGPLTRGALERFRKKYNKGTGGVLDEKTQLALAQRALEEIRQQSLFSQLGVLDEATRRELITFKSERGLGTDATLDDATLKALADAVKSGITSLSSPTMTSEPGDRISVSPSISESVSPKLGKLVSRRNGRTVFEYNFTQDDVEWTAKLITGEASARDDLSTRAVIAALLNRYALFTNRVYPTFTAFIRAYSTPLQPVLRNKNVAEWHYKNNRQNFQSIDGTYPGTNIPRGQLKRHLALQRTPWNQLSDTARRIALEALTGSMPDTGIGLASEFASTWILYGRRVGNQNRTEAGWLNYTQNFKRDKGWRWIGHKPNLEQKRNAFFIDPRAANLPPGSVRVDKPSN
jgi:hypothetical protein